MAEFRKIRDELYRHDGRLLTYMKINERGKTYLHIGKLITSGDCPKGDYQSVSLLEDILFAGNASKHACKGFYWDVKLPLEDEVLKQDLTAEDMDIMGLVIRGDSHDCAYEPLDKSDYRIQDVKEVYEFIKTIDLSEIPWVYMCPHTELHNQLQEMGLNVVVLSIVVDKTTQQRTPKIYRGSMKVSNN